MATRVVTAMKRWTVYPWIIALVVLFVFVLYRDLNGTGLKQSIYYRALGLGLYPLFYGSLAYAVYHFAGMLSVADRYLRVGYDKLIIGRKKAIERSEIQSLVIERNWLGLKELRFRFRNGEKMAVKSYALERPAEDVHSVLEDWRKAGEATAAP